MTIKISHLLTASRRSVKVMPEVGQKKDVDIVQVRREAPQVLSFADENDRGTDPYNNTGQHATLGATTKF